MLVFRYSLFSLPFSSSILVEWNKNVGACNFAVAIMNKVKLKFIQGNKPDHEDLLKVISKFDVKCHKVQDVNSDHICLWCNSLSDVDILFSPPCISALKQICCSPQLPPNLRAKRTLILRRLDDLIIKRDKSEIILEIQEKNPWLQIVDSFLFNGSPTLKLTCQTNEMASKALTSGILLFNMSVPPSNIAQEEYIHVTICYKCYALNDHVTASCNKPNDYRVCSICASTDHTYRQCKSSTKKCINCGGLHSALAMACTARKQIVKTKRLSAQKPSYADAAQSVNVSSNFSSIFGSTSDIMAKAVMCITVSTLKNAEQPGSFHDTLNHLLEVNSLPKFCMGNVTPPKQLPSVPAEDGNSSGSGVVMEDSTSSHDLSLTSSQDAVADVLTLSQETNSITIYKRRSAGNVTPGTVEELFAKGNIIFKDSSLNDADHIALLSSLAPLEFKRIANIIEVKPKEYEQLSHSMTLRSKKQSKAAVSLVN